MALALPPGGKVVTCDRNDKVIEIARGYWAAAGVADKARRSGCGPPADGEPAGAASSLSQGHRAHRKLVLAPAWLALA